jgi:acyl-CoA thioester hydrolase
MPHFTAHRRVEFADTDMAGIVHFANFFKWMEQAEHDYFRSLGLSIMQKRDDGSYIGWPRVSASCNFRKPVAYDEDVEIDVTVERIGVKSVTYQMTVRRGNDEIAVGRMKVACCVCTADGALESIEIPADYLAKLPPQQELEQHS